MRLCLELNCIFLQMVFVNILRLNMARGADAMLTMAPTPRSCERTTGVTCTLLYSYMTVVTKLDRAVIAVVQIILTIMNDASVYIRRVIKSLATHNCFHPCPLCPVGVASTCWRLYKGNLGHARRGANGRSWNVALRWITLFRLVEIQKWSCIISVNNALNLAPRI